ncbi:MAG: sodium/proton-translocating pyrophosphatase, partial [Methylobacter sp.]
MMFPASVSVVIALLMGIVGSAFVMWELRRVLGYDQGNETMQAIAKAIQEGSAAFLSREYRVIAIFVVIVATVISIFLQWQTALCFVVGAIASAGAGYLGMYVAVRANVRTAAAAGRNLHEGLRVAFGSGSIMGMAVVSFSLIGMTILFLIFNGNPSQLIYVTGFGFGASSIALFARVGGGIYTKAADVGADLVGKVEQGIPEDDPRNPAVIADNVGDNVGDVAGMGADLFESYSGSIIAAATLGAALGDKSPAFIGLPFLVAAVGIIASLFGIYMVTGEEPKQSENGKDSVVARAARFIGQYVIKIDENASLDDLLKALRHSVWGASVVILGLSLLAILISGVSFNYWLVILVGLTAGNAIAYVTEYYTSYTDKPTQAIAHATQTGAATTIIQGLAVGMMSTVFPVLIVAVAILMSIWLGHKADGTIAAGLYAVALAGVGMLSTLG